MNVFLETERLLLEPIGLESLSGIVAMDSDPAVMRFLGPVPGDLEAHRKAMAVRIIEWHRWGPDLGFWAVLWRATREFTGWIHLRPSSMFPGETELGYRMSKCFWGRGIATEASRTVLRHGREKAALNRVIATTLARNYGSIKVMEKLGMKLEEEFIIPKLGFPYWNAEERRALKFALDYECQSCRRIDTHPVVEN